LEAGRAKAKVSVVKLKSTLEAVTLRFATPDDASALRRLAQLDTGSVPTGPTLIAEVDGVLTAAVPINGGEPVADPFLPTAGLVRLLKHRAAQMRGKRQ
jgi:hypothetical protein